LFSIPLYFHLMPKYVAHDEKCCCCFILGKYLDFVNILNWKDVQRKNVVNNDDMSSLRAPRQNDPYKTQHTEQHKTRRTPRRNRHLYKNIIFFVFSDVSFLFIFYL